MYESRNMPVISSRAFIQRMLLHFAGALLLIILTLAIGVAGHFLFDDNIA